MLRRWVGCGVTPLLGLSWSSPAQSPILLREDENGCKSHDEGATSPIAASGRPFMSSTSRHLWKFKTHAHGTFAILIGHHDVAKIQAPDFEAYVLRRRNCGGWDPGHCLVHRRTQRSGRWHSGGISPSPPLPSPRRHPRPAVAMSPATVHPRPRSRRSPRPRRRCRWHRRCRHRASSLIATPTTPMSRSPCGDDDDRPASRSRQ